MYPIYEQHGVIPGWQRLDIGGVKLTFLSDGIATYQGPHPLIGADKTPGEVNAVAVSAFMPTDRIYMSLNILVAETGNEVVVFDTGIGELGRQGGLGLLASVLEKTGYSASDVTAVMFTHLHADHICGLLEDGRPLFPNARYLVGKVEYDYWTSEAAKAGPRPENIDLVASYVTPFLDRITFIEGGQEALPGITAINAFGHSPGHLIFEVQTNSGPFAVVGDVLLNHVYSFERPDWLDGFDADPQLAAETRQRVLADLAERRIPFAAFHLPLPGLGFVEETERAFRYVPTSYQFA